MALVPHVHRLQAAIDVLLACVHHYKQYKSPTEKRRETERERERDHKYRTYKRDCNYRIYYRLQDYITSCRHLCALHSTVGVLSGRRCFSQAPEAADAENSWLITPPGLAHVGTWLAHVD